MEEDTEYHKLPIEEQCQHKLWKARVHGYEAATKLFNEITDEKSSEWHKYLGLLKKFVSDSNAFAQDKALDSVLAYVENAGCAGKTCGEVMSGLINKCLGAPKAKTKEKAISIIQMYIEIEKQEIVEDELIKGFSIKNPKVVAACVQVLRESLREFGTKIIMPKPLIKQIPTLLEDRDKGIREEAKQLTIEVYRWIGVALKPQLASLKPVQITELEVEFEKLGTSKPIPTRYIRSQQELQSKAKQINTETADDAEDDLDGHEKDEVDAFDLLEPVNILSQLPNDFYEKCEAKKWQERKEAMDSLVGLTSNPKLENGDYGDLVRILKKIISKDSNVVIVATAGKCLTGLANGLKNKFHPYAVQCIQVLLEKFKEKKQIVVQAMKEAIDAIYPSTSLESIQEDVIAALDNKNPSVKAETIAFITRCFICCTPQILNKKLLKAFCTSLLKTLNDTDPTVRDNSAEALGTGMKVVGEKNILPFINEVEALKMTKIKECCDKAVIVLPKVKSMKTRFASASVQKPSEPEAQTSVQTKKPSTARAPSKITKRPMTSRGGKLRAGGSGNKGKPSTSELSTPRSEATERELSIEDAKEIAISVFPSKVYDDLVDTTWKIRLLALEQLLSAIKSMEHDQVPTQAIILAIARKPGFKDTNFQVLKLKFEIILYMATECSFSRVAAQLCVTELADKLGDTKNGSLAADALLAIAETTKFDFVSGQVLEGAFAQKNPKTHAEALNWLSSATKEFGLQFQVRSVLEYIKKALTATNPVVRAAAITLLGTMYLYIGPSLRTFFDAEKGALLQQIDGEFEKLQGMTPPQPTRGLTMKTKANNDDDDDEIVMGDGVPPVINVADLIPRTDICDLISAELLENLADKNWKVRGEALQKLATIVGDAKFITPNLGGLPSILKARLNDSNKNLAIQSLNICQAIGTAMGPNCTKHVRTLAPGIVVSLGDNKSLVRLAALNCLNAWVEQCGISPFVEGDTLSDALKLENPTLRAELLSWLAEKLAAVKTISPDLNLCVPLLYGCLEDRNGDVRKNAQEAVLPFIIHIGYDTMVQISKKLKPASKTTVTAILEKARLNLPVKNLPKSKQPACATGTKINSSAKVQDDNEKNAEGIMCGAKGMKRATSKNKLSGNAKVVKKNEEEEKLPPMQLNNIKEQRLLDEQRLKVLKWNFTTPRDEFYDQLKDQMTVAGFSSALQICLFHSDFKFHIKAIDTFMECLENPEVSISNLDLILKWLALRFFDTNPSVLLKGLEYLKQLFIQLNNHGYQLQEYEANIFVPYLTLKVGDSKDTVRQSVRNIFKLICHIYSPSKLFLYIMEGLKSKNARQRTECLELLANLIEMFGVNVCNPNASIALKEITKHISDRDNSVRNAALNCIVQAYFLDGEKVYKYLGPIPDKELCLLEERIKRASRNRAATPKPASANVTVNSNAKIAQSILPVDNQKDNDVESIIVKRNNVPGNNVQPQSRPVSGMFSLDLDKIEEMMEEKNEHDLPKLVKPDLDDILSKPIKLPETRLRPPSPATKLLMLSADAASALDLVISQIASNDTVVTINALVQIDEFLKDESRSTLMMSRVDQLLLAESLQFRMTYTRHIDNESTRKQVLKLYRCLAMTLVTMFRHENLAKKASTDVLKDLLYNLVAVLLDDRLNTIEEGPQVIRSLNVLVISIIDRADPTKVLCGVIKLLHDCIASESCSTRFIDIVMKCHWKLLRMIPSVVDELSLDHVLLEIHLFLRAFPSPSWRRQSSDVPLRTIKTILHTLVEHAGNRVMSHLKMIDSLQDSEMEMYLQKLLRRNSVKHSRITSDSPGRENRSTSRKEIKNHRRLSKNTHEMLAEIFKKIGAKEYTKEGLIDLYNFKKSHPEADIAPFLLRSSQFFQDYIERGLRTIETEHENSIGNSLCNVSSHSTVTHSGTNVQKMVTADGALTSTTMTLTTSRVTSGEYDTSIQDDFNPSVYMDRLKALRAQCGYDNAKYDNSGVIKSATPPEPMCVNESKLETQILMQGMPRSESSDAVSTLSKSNMDVDDLRQRLERIKNAKI